MLLSGDLSTSLSLRCAAVSHSMFFSAQGKVECAGSLPAKPFGARPKTEFCCLACLKAPSEVVFNLKGACSQHDVDIKVSGVALLIGAVQSNNEEKMMGINTEAKTFPGLGTPFGDSSAVIDRNK